MQITASLGYLLNTASRYMKQQLDILMTDDELTSAQWAILKYLHPDKQLTQSEIAEGLKGDRATIGSIINRLHEKQYVIKVENPVDRRAFLVRLAPRADETVKRLDCLAQKVNSQALSGLNKEEIEMLFKVLPIIIDNLSREGIA